MAVRFLPPAESRGPANRDPGEDFAGVVEMRSWLRPPEGASAAEKDEEEDLSSGGAPASESSWGAASVNENSLDASSASENPWRSASTRKGSWGSVGSWGSDSAAGESSEAEAEAEAEADMDSAPGSAGLETQRTDKRDAIITHVQFGRAPVEEPSDDLEDVAGLGSEDPEAEATDSSGFSEPEERGPVYDDAVRLLARRARSSGELRSDLLALDHPAQEVSIIIDEFVDCHYLDDLGLARVQSEKLRDSKGASKGQIRRKLRERKLPDSVIDEVVNELDDDEEYALLRETANKRAEKLAGLDRQTAQRRLLGFLARRGWSGEPVMRAVNEALDGSSAGGRGARGGRGSGGVRFE